MELISIVLARVVALIQVQQWDPLGKTLTLEALSKLGSRYSFASLPTRLEDVDFHKGFELREGRLADIRIDRITVFVNGIVIDTRSSTDDSQKVLEDILRLAEEAFGAIIKPVRWTFTSHLMFRSEMRLASLNPVLSRIANVLTERASADMKHAFNFEPTTVMLNVDTSQAKTPPAVFSIERRADVPFSENTYFSSAPLRTSEHIEIVKAFETSLL